MVGGDGVDKVIFLLSWGCDNYANKPIDCEIHLVELYCGSNPGMQIYNCQVKARATQGYKRAMAPCFVNLSPHPPSKHILD